MATSLDTCQSCTNPLPEKAKFCPSCGTVTPIAVNMATGQVVVSAPPAAKEEGSDQRDRLQRALGDGLKIRRLLGRGGFAEVWAAFDVRLKREVAVKTLRYDLVISDTLLQRFQREAEAVAKLRHPNIIPIYEVGEGEGIAYFVMPMIEGESLGEALEREGSFQVDEACRILREAAGALAAAHRAGIVHRDIKPDNLMLEGPERRPVVMDFGIAKATGGGESNLTGTGMAMGTPHYMSPEQASGQKDLDARSDQYALAMVGYRMLAGQLPFQADSMPTLIMKQIAEIPKPVIELRPDTPRQLSDALARALSKDPNARFASMEEFAAAIPTFGSQGSEAAAQRRRRPTATEIARFPGATIPSWHNPLVALGLVGLVVAIALFFVNGTSAAAITAQKRDDAMFVGRAFLTKHGANGSFDERMTLAKDDTAFLWLQRSMGVKDVDTRSTTGLPIWRWTLRWQRKGPGNARETWNAAVAPDGRIVRFIDPQVDSTPGAILAADSALRIGEAFIREVGYDPTELTRVQDSVVRRAKRTDHIFQWEVRKAALVGQKADTAMPKLRVTVGGDRVQSYRSWLEIPKSYTATLKEGSVRTAMIITVVVAWTVLVIGAIGLAVSRQRTDELQWKTALKLSIVALLLVGVSFIQNPDAFNTDSLVSAILGFLFLGLFTMCGLLFGLVAGESLATEVNPPALVGYESLAKLRVLSNEWAGAIAHGLAIGGIVLAIDKLMSFIVSQAFWKTASVPDGVTMIAPWSLPLGVFGAGIVTVSILFFAVHLVARFTKRPWIAILLPAVVVTAMAFESATQPWLAAFEGGIIVGVLSWTVWRYGFLACVIAFWVSEVLSSALGLLAVGNGPYLPAALASIAAVIAVAVLGFFAAKRGPRVASAR
jgi:tRNA A-37 threonylcarbamoyl transferase component Bud32